jgi:hypothetical protein
MGGGNWSYFGSAESSPKRYKNRVHVVITTPMATHNPHNTTVPLLKEVVLHNILTFLPLNSVLNIITTSNDSQSIALSSPFLCLGSQLSPTSSRLTRTLQRFSHVAYVQVDNAQLLVQAADFSSFAQTVPHVVHLQLTNLRLNCKTGGAFVEAFRPRFGHLRELSLHGAMFPTDAALDQMVLHLSGRTLTSLSLIGCRTLKDMHVNVLLSKCPSLQHLSLPDCTRLNAPNLIHRDLKSIDFSKCTSISKFPTVRLPSVVEILLPWCRNINNTSIEQIVSSSGQLQHLNVNGCIKIQSLQLKHGRQLRTMQLGMCEQLQTLRVESCPELRSLPVGLCIELKHLTLVNCPKMKDIDVSLLPKVKSVHIEQCPRVEVVNITTTRSCPATVTILPEQQMTRIMNECARLAKGQSPGATGQGTGMMNM